MHFYTEKGGAFCISGSCLFWGKKEGKRDIQKQEDHGVEELSLPYLIMRH